MNFLQSKQCRSHQVNPTTFNDPLQIVHYFLWPNSANIGITLFALLHLTQLWWYSKIRGILGVQETQQRWWGQSSVNHLCSHVNSHLTRDPVVKHHGSTSHSLDKFPMPVDKSQEPYNWHLWGFNFRIDFLNLTRTWTRLAKVSSNVSPRPLILFRYTITISLILSPSPSVWIAEMWLVPHATQMASSQIGTAEI